MVAGLLGNESSDSNRFTLVTPKSENDVRLQATLGNQNPTGLPVGVVSKTSLPLMIVLIILQYIFRKQSTCILIEFNVAYSIVRMMPLVSSMHTLGIKGIITLIICFLFLNTSTLLMYRIHSLNL